MSPAEAIACPICRHSNPPGAIRCTGCQSAIHNIGNATLTNAGWSRPADSSAPASLSPGTLLSGRYEIIQALGQGGMGAVYKAKDLELERFVAIKVIRAELASDPKSLQRFKQEMILARQITHKNVVRIFDLGTHE